MELRKILNCSFLSHQVIVFLDDLNMPAMEQYGAQPPLELLRQFMELGGFYDTHKLAWKVSEEIFIISYLTVKVILAFYLFE